jgi:predicted DNA-binding transcriptional regulator AlpA
MLSVKDVVAVTGLSRATVYRLMQRTDFPTVKIGFRKGVRPEALEKYLKDHEEETL